MLLYELIRNAFGCFVNVCVVARKLRVERASRKPRCAANRLAARPAQGYAMHPEASHPRQGSSHGQDCRNHGRAVSLCKCKLCGAASSQASSSSRASPPPRGAPLSPDVRCPCDRQCSRNGLIRIGIRSTIGGGESPSRRLRTSSRSRGLLRFGASPGADRSLRFCNAVRSRSSVQWRPPRQRCSPSAKRRHPPSHSADKNTALSERSCSRCIGRNPAGGDAIPTVVLLPGELPITPRAPSMRRT